MRIPLPSCPGTGNQYVFLRQLAARRHERRIGRRRDLDRPAYPLLDGRPGLAPCTVTVSVPEKPAAGPSGVRSIGIKHDVPAACGDERAIDDRHRAIRIAVIGEHAMRRIGLNDGVFNACGGIVSRGAQPV